MQDDFCALAVSLGIDRAEMIGAEQIVMDRRFREQCASNACGVYGKCWMCPPNVGDIDALMEEARGYASALLYQSIHQLEDSFDYEGMVEGGRRHSMLSSRLDQALKSAGYSGFLHLSKGGCGVCATCAKIENKPCRFPEKALASLEAYGVNVSATVKHTSMKYINGVNTVTYFGLILFKENAPCLS